MHSSGAYRLCLLSMIVLTTACNSEQPTTPGTPQLETARLRIVNAAPGVQGVEVVRTGVATPLAQNLNYGSFTQSCITLPANIAHTLAFRSGGTEVATATFTPVPDGRYSAFLTSAGTTRRAFIVADDDVVPAGNNGLRFINVSSAAGDVHVTTPGGAVTASTRAFGNIGRTAMGNAEPDYIMADTSRKQVRLFDVDATTGTPRADVALSGLPASRLVSVVLADVASAGPSASFVAFPC